MKQAMAALMILGALTGCSPPASEPDSSPPLATNTSNTTNSSNSTEQPVVSTTTPEIKEYPLNFTSSSVASELPVSKSVEQSMIITSQSVGEGQSTVIIYQKDEEVVQIHAALESKEGVYEIGQIGYGNANNYSIEETEAFGQSYIKIIGTVGANAPISYYVSLATSPPTLMQIGAHTVEADVDQDGSTEIVATVGTAAQTTVYKMENDSLMSANLNEIMDAYVVLFDANTNTFQADVIEGQLSSWKIEDDVLRFIP